MQDSEKMNFVYYPANVAKHHSFYLFIAGFDLKLFINVNSALSFFPSTNWSTMSVFFMGIDR